MNTHTPIALPACRPHDDRRPERRGRALVNAQALRGIKARVGGRVPLLLFLAAAAFSLTPYATPGIALAVGGYRLQVYARVPAVGSPESLIAARVRVRGTAATHYNAALRHLTFVSVYVPRLEDFTVLDAETANPFDQPVVPLNRVAQYRRDAGSAKRVHVHGTVTHRRVGEDLFIQDDSGGIRIETSQLEAFDVGDSVDAVGFLEYEAYLPLLRDSFVRRAGPRGRRPSPPRW